MKQFNRNESLQQLEGKDWGEPAYDSYLVTECHRLRRVPLREFTAESFRIMIGQQIGLPYLVPMALELLRTNPFTAGDFYGGDLLAAMLRVEAAFWLQHPDLRRQTAAVAEQAFASLPTLEEIDQQTARKALTEAYDLFKKSEMPTT